MCRDRYNRRVDIFRRKLAEATDISKAGKLGAVFLLYHYEHPTELCAAIEARWPSLRFVLLTLNLVAEDADVATSPRGAGNGCIEHTIIDGLQGTVTARKVDRGARVHTYLTADGEWTDTQYRWARGLAPSSDDECSQLAVHALPPDCPWTTNDNQCGDNQARQRWCFYNVRVPRPELPWIEAVQVAGEELDRAVRSAVGNALDSLMRGASQT